MQNTQSEQVAEELSMSHSEVLAVLKSEKSVPDIVELSEDGPTPEEVKMATDEIGCPGPLKQKLQSVVRSINEVLGPKHFKSDWHLKWEKKCTGTNKNNRAPQGKRSDGKRAHGPDTNSGQVVHASKGYDPDWKIGSKFKRQKGASMTDFAM